MNPVELHRAVLTATALGDDERYARLRRRFTAPDHRGEFDHLSGAALVCLAYRFGDLTDLAEIGDRDQPRAIAATRLDRVRLREFMDELRAAPPGYWSDQGTPASALDVEAVIRSLRGEPHLVGDVGGDRVRFALRFLVRYLTGTVPVLREEFDTVVDLVRVHLTNELLGRI